MPHQIGAAQGKAEAVGIQPNPQGLQISLQALGQPLLGETRCAGNPPAPARRDMAHRQHQIHLLPFSEIEADLEVQFLHAAQRSAQSAREAGLEVEG